MWLTADVLCFGKINTGIPELSKEKLLCLVNTSLLFLQNTVSLLYIFPPLSREHLLHGLSLQDVERSTLRSQREGNHSSSFHLFNDEIKGHIRSCLAEQHCLLSLFYSPFEMQMERNLLSCYTSVFSSLSRTHIPKFFCISHHSGYVMLCFKSFPWLSRSLKHPKWMQKSS